LFVEERWRSKGVGRKLMAQLARLARERGANSIGWSVLKWNEPAIGFYHRIGGEQLEAWHYFQLRGEALDQLARDATSR
jgi:GNAT superfamily N-acetyltransferase